MVVPTAKKCGDVFISVDADRVQISSGYSILNHEEARDLHYALTRIVAYLDYKERK